MYILYFIMINTKHIYLEIMDTIFKRGCFVFRIFIAQLFTYRSMHSVGEQKVISKINL